MLHHYLFNVRVASCCVLCLQDVEAARQEASENVKFLKPLRRFLEKVNTMDDFVALADQFKPLLHVMLLIWKHSSSYSSSARFATLLREVCNDLIMQVCGYACFWRSIAS
jgi:dynein heavy chain